MSRAAEALRHRPAASGRSPGNGRLKLLIVSWYFPPGNTIGAVRVGKLAKFLHTRGIDFRVLTARDWGLPETLPLEIPAERVISAPWLNLNALPRPLSAARDWLRRSAASSGGGDGVPAVARPTRRLGLGEAYRTLTNVPDRQIGWLPHALAQARRGLGDWRPDLIYASAPPFTSLIVADRLSARYRCPWVIEFRDRWVDDPVLTRKPPWRMALETRWERRLVGRAAGIVTVSEPWAESFRAKYAGKPVATIFKRLRPRRLWCPRPCSVRPRARHRPAGRAALDRLYRRHLSRAPRSDAAVRGAATPRAGCR
ncbi:MAG: glycosyltransferase [Pseudomonadota bacterium]